VVKGDSVIVAASLESRKHPPKTAVDKEEEEVAASHPAIKLLLSHTSLVAVACSKTVAVAAAGALATSSR
jgi:hypothetical protein